MEQAISINYELLAKHIVAEQMKYPNENELLWSTKECAEYLKVSPATFRDRTSKTPGFPRPLGFSNGEYRSQPKWLKRDVGEMGNVTSLLIELLCQL